MNDQKRTINSLHPLAFVKYSRDFRQRLYLYFQYFLLTICEIRIRQAFPLKNSQFIIMCILHNSTHLPQQSQRVTNGLPVFSCSTSGHACTTSGNVYQRQNYSFCCRSYSWKPGFSSIFYTAYLSFALECIFS